MFFSDIAGFTETTDKMESEDLTQLLNQYLTEMSRIALDHGATIDKYIGDAIMIFFGDPEFLGCGRGRHCLCQDGGRNAKTDTPARSCLARCWH